MTEMSEIDFAAQFRPPAAASVDAVLQRRRATPDMDELRQAAEEKAAKEAISQAQEARAMMNRAAGNPQGELSRAQHLAGAARDKVRDLEDQLAKARSELHLRAEQVVDFSHAVDEVYAASARRSDDSTFGAAKRAAAAAHVDATLARASSETGVTDAHRAELQAAIRGQQTGYAR